MQRQFHFDESRITLPKGTRVVLKTDLKADDGYLCKAGTVGVVIELAYDSYAIRTPTGRRVDCQRDQIVIQSRDRLADIGRRQHDWQTLANRVIFSSVVGSVAWNLADETSDEDVKGVFVLPFEGAAGLWQPVDEIHDPTTDTQYWEVQKVVYQGLRADANTLEMLWSPHVRTRTELGERLLKHRRIFVSQHIFGTFGRYAMSQFRKMRSARQRYFVQRRIVELLRVGPEPSQAELIERLCGEAGAQDGEQLFSGKGARRRAEEAIRDLYRSLFDRGLLDRRGYEPLLSLLRGDDSELLSDEPRWKNAYNLLRLLASGARWLREGEPLIEVEGDLREELLAVKHGQVPMAQILARADELAEDLEHAFGQTRLPEQPDYEAAHQLLLICREQAAREHLRRARRLTPVTGELAAVDEGGISNAVGEHREPSACQAPRRFELPEAALKRFLDGYGDFDFLVCSVVGSHSYGFPSRDSDFDLKAIHLAPAPALLGLDHPRSTEQYLDEFEGHEIDFTSHEARDALGRLLKGDGNVLERILSPYLVRPAEPDARLDELRVLALANLSKRFFRHYAGFFNGMVRAYKKEASRKIKPLLYMYRVALTGVHLLTEGELLADLELLVERYRFERVRKLMSLKAEAELATVDDDRPYLELVPELERLLEQAREKSDLPDEPPACAELDSWLAEQRWP